MKLCKVSRALSNLIGNKLWTNREDIVVIDTDVLIPVWSRLLMPKTECMKCFMSDDAHLKVIKNFILSSCKRLRLIISSQLQWSF